MVLASNDGGCTWTDVTPSQLISGTPVRLNKVKYLNGQFWLLGNGVMFVSMSVDNGRVTWMNVSNRSSSAFTGVDMYDIEYSSTYLVATGTGIQIFNGDISAPSFPSGGVTDTVGAFCLTSTISGTTKIVCGIRSDTSSVTNARVVYISTDGGATFRTYAVSFSGATTVVCKIKLLSESNSLIVVGMPSGQTTAVSTATTEL